MPAVSAVLQGRPADLGPARRVSRRESTRATGSEACEGAPLERRMTRMSIVQLVTRALVFLAPGVALAQDSVAATDRYAAVARALTTFIEHERSQKAIPAISIALVDGQRIVWARGFGWADSAANRCARRRRPCIASAPCRNCSPTSASCGSSSSDAARSRRADPALPSELPSEESVRRRRSRFVN